MYNFLFGHRKDDSEHLQNFAKRLRFVVECVLN